MRVRMLLSENEECRMKASTVQGENEEWRIKVKCYCTQLRMKNGDRIGGSS